MFQKIFKQHNRQQGFLPVSSNDENAATETEAFNSGYSHVPPSGVSLTLVIVAVALLFSSAGFFAGRQTNLERFNGGLLGKRAILGECLGRQHRLTFRFGTATSGAVQTTLTWNATFSRMPPERHFMEWKALFPGTV